MNEEKLRKNMGRAGVVFFTALFCCFLWGSAAPCIKIGYGIFGIGEQDSMAQIVFAGIRFTMAGLLVILLGSLLQKKALKPAKASWPMVLKLAMVQTVAQYIFFYIGVAHTSGVKSSIIVASNVFLSIFVAAVCFGMEKLNAKKVAGCLIGFAGVVLINLSGGGIDMNFSLQGEGFVFLSALSYAFSSAMIKRYSAAEDTVTLSGYQFLCGGLLLTAAGLLCGGRVELTAASLGGYGLLVYLAFISAAAYTLWGLLLKYNPVARVAVYGFMNPMCGVLLSALLLGESSQAFGLTGLAALVLVCAGILVVNGGGGRAGREGNA